MQEGYISLAETNKAEVETLIPAQLEVIGRDEH